jgi:hypothetical protein
MKGRHTTITLRIGSFMKWLLLKPSYLRRQATNKVLLLISRGKG